ncbi:MAG TPA: agmatinase [Pseudobdellovibrionaceae bacterium]|nr:agmatinase [Pseudobdellovibrionaceae bacterium]
MEYTPLSGREYPRFSAIKTFFRLPVAKIDDDYDIGIFGVPFDGGVSYRPGARFAPSQVRELSSLGRGYHESHEWNLFQQTKVADLGDCSIIPIDLKESYKKIENFSSSLLERNKKFLAIGGDHSITLPLLRALHKKYKQPLNLIHFDAHLDTYPAAWGHEYHHGSFARHAVEEGLVNPKKMIQIGIRGPFAGKEDLDFALKHKIQIVSMKDIKNEAVLKKLLKPLSDWTEPTYLTFDIDCMDPAFAPGTGTPVPGGMSSYEVLQILQILNPLKNLVGADLVEICPAYDPAQITSLLGTSIAFELLNLMINK